MGADRTMLGMRALALALLLAGALGTESSAGAQPRPLEVSGAAQASGALGPAPQEEADRFFREGVALREAGDANGAIERLRRAHRLDPAPRTAYNLAVALADAGRYLEARSLLRRLVSAGVDDDLLIHDAARALLDAVDPQVASLRIAIVGAVPGQRLVIDGARAATGAREVGLDPGAHRVELHSPSGVVLARAHVSLAPGEREHVTLRPAAIPARLEEPALETTAAPTQPAPPDERDDGELWMWVGIGAGIAVVLTAILVGTTIAISEASSDPMPDRRRDRDRERD